MGLGKHFYTKKCEGYKLSVKEQKFFGLRPIDTEPKKRGRPKKSSNDNDKDKFITDLLDGLI
jgi:hypothetical protein